MVKEHNKATEERKEKDNMHGACDAGAMHSTSTKFCNRNGCIPVSV